MTLCCLDVVADPRLIYINLHVQSEIPNSKNRKSNQSISVARLGLEKPVGSDEACQSRWWQWWGTGGGARDVGV